MQFRNKTQIVVWTVIALFIVSSSLLSLPHVKPFDALAGPQELAATHSLEARLKIPSIGVDAEIESLGLTTSGAMDAPDGPRTVGWFSPGPRPGETGSAVIAGHRGWKDGIPAVFDDLDKLRKGDHIVVVDEQGKETSFVVRETRIYDKDAVAPEVFSSSEGTHLNLITCTGAWNDELQSTQERLVVFADLAV